MFGSDVAAAVPIIVAEVPGFAGRDAMPAAGAPGGAGGDEGREAFTQLAVVVPVAAIWGPTAPPLSGAVLLRALAGP